MKVSRLAFLFIVTTLTSLMPAERAIAQTTTPNEILPQPRGKGEELQKAIADLQAASEKIAALEKGAEENKKTVADVANLAAVGTDRGDTAWMMTASAFVL